MSKLNLIKYFGGKFAILDNLFPFPKHTSYIEPFCGSAIVLLNKIKSYSECINDVNSRLINFWRVVQSRGFKREFFQLICKYYGHLDSRELFQECLKGIDNDIIDAFRFLYVNRHSFSGMTESYHGLGFKSSNFEHHKEYFQKLNNIDACSERLKGVRIENQDFRQLLKRCDRPETLIYCDPPYILGGDHYERCIGGQSWSISDAEDLRDLLWKFENSQIIISYDDPNFFLKDNWTLETIKRTHTPAMRYDAEAKDYTEYIIRNFDKKTTPTMKRKPRLKSFFAV